MRKGLLSFVFIVVTILTISSCSTARSGSHSNNAYQTPRTSVDSYNNYDLNVSNEGVSYTIDISTPEGKAKLNKLSLKEAENLALTEAVIKYKCALLVNPQFTNLMNGKRVLRITVYGFPAVYKNQEKKDPEIIRPNKNVKVIVN